MHIIGQHGLGDGIYLRSFLPRDREVYLKTPWPELYLDIANIKCVKLGSILRTQAKNEINSGYDWHQAPDNAKWIRAQYAGMPIFKGLERSTRQTPAPMSLPDFGQRPNIGKYVIVRPATIRKEYNAIGRNPRPEYIAMAAQSFIDAGFDVVSIADIDNKNEMPDGDLPPCTIRYNAGELSVSDVLRHTQHASAIIGGIGWIVPAAIAQNRPALIICGGSGGITGPNMITDTRMNLDNITFLKPDNFCQCKGYRHDCDKRIEEIQQHIDLWITDLV